jgi:hypothetical protein
MHLAVGEQHCSAEFLNLVFDALSTAVGDSSVSFAALCGLFPVAGRRALESRTRAFFPAIIGLPPPAARPCQRRRGDASYLYTHQGITEIHTLTTHTLSHTYTLTQMCARTHTHTLSLSHTRHTHAPSLHVTHSLTRTLTRIDFSNHSHTPHCPLRPQTGCPRVGFRLHEL